MKELNFLLVKSKFNKKLKLITKKLVDFCPFYTRFSWVRLLDATLENLVFAAGHVS